MPRLVASWLSCVLGGFLVLGFAAKSQAAASLDLGQAEDKSVVFNAIGKPSFLKIEGKGSGLTGKITKDGEKFSGKADFDLNSLETGLSLRDHHMKEKYLQTEQFPKATLAIKKLPWGKTDTGDFDATDGPFAGELTLHGVTQPVTGTATVGRSGKTLTAHIEFSTDLSSYKIDIPSFKGITVADTVEIKIDVKGPVGG